MKFKEMNDSQQDAIKEVLLIGLNVRTQDERKYTYEFYRLLALGNGMGIVLLGTFMGAVIDKSGQVSMLRTPLILFCIGALLAALVYVPLFSVANAATVNVTEQVTEFFLNRKEFETIRGFDLNCAGRVVVLVLLFSSLTMFAVGVLGHHGSWQTLIALPS